MIGRKKREQKVAKKHGGRAQPASGALWGMKRDVRSRGKFLMEHKETSLNEYSFDIRDFIYLENQCADPVAVYCVEFTGYNPLYIVDAGWKQLNSALITTNSHTISVSPINWFNRTVLFKQHNKKVIVVDRKTYDEILRENGYG